MQVVHHVEMRDGKGYVIGRNVKAEMVARMYIGTGYSIEEVMEQYNLSAAEVHACIAYYYDNQADLDARHAEVEQWLKENAMTLDQFKAKLAARKDQHKP